VTIARGIVLPFLLAPGVGLAITLVDPGHMGVVVEPGTGKPVAGATVVGKWKVTYSSVAHSGERCVKSLVVEADSEGRFYLPGWTREDTPVTSFYLLVYGYRPGYRFDQSPKPAIAEPDLAMRWFEKGGLSLPPETFRMEMAPWAPPPDERARHLLRMIPMTSCPEGEEDVARYRFLRSIQEEFAAFPPEAQSSGRMDYLPWLKSMVDKARERLPRDDPAWREQRKP